LANFGHNPGRLAITAEQNMSEPKKEEKKETGIEVDSVTFDSNGEVEGVDESVLDGVAGGLQAGDSGCINGFNC
jgi:hypothetical protein